MFKVDIYAKLYFPITYVVNENHFEETWLKIFYGIPEPSLPS